MDNVRKSYSSSQTQVTVFRTEWYSPLDWSIPIR